MIKYLLYYFAAISFISLVICVYDKIAAKRWTKHRIRESTLIWLSVLGGSVAMYLTMQIIRHKTLHKKFMVGIPVIIIIQAIAIYFLFPYLNV